MNTQQLTAALKSAATELGFQLSGACPAVPAAGWNRFQQWLSRGFGGEMRFLEDRADAYRHPQSVLEGVRSLLMLGMNYRTSEPERAGPGEGRIARYAWGSADYHDLVRSRLNRLSERLLEWAPGARVRGIVDTAPLFEREYAQLAGLGWIGKNTLLLNRQSGSWFFLAALLTDRELDYDAPHATDHCGSCRACLDACPTAAFPQPYVLDATRCISYLTIELRSAVPPHLRPLVGDWLFGCDVCQEVCPWNRRAPRGDEPSFSPTTGSNPRELARLFFWSEADFRRELRGTPLWRAKRRGLLRNAALVLGNQRALAAIPALAQGLRDPDAVVREACAWALGRLDSATAQEVLASTLPGESDPAARQEILRAIGGGARQHPGEDQQRTREQAPTSTARRRPLHRN